MPNLFGRDSSWIDTIQVGFDPSCDFYDQAFCYTVRRLSRPPSWSGYRTWFDWGNACSGLWGYEPSWVIKRCLEHMRRARDPRLERLGDWVHCQETDPEHYRQQLQFLCRDVTSFNFFAKAQSWLAHVAFHPGGSFSFDQPDVISVAAPKDLAKPLTINLKPRRSVPSIDAALASLIATAKGLDFPGMSTAGFVPPGSQQSWVKVRAFYDDLWQTPFSGNPIKIWINKAPALMNQPLNTGSQPNSSASTLPAAQKTAHEPGTQLLRDVAQGDVQWEIVPEAGQEQAIQELRNAIDARLNGAYHDLVGQMSGFQEQWDEYGSLSIYLSGYQGLFGGAEEWLEDQEDLLEKETWVKLGDQIGDAFTHVRDVTESYLVDKYKSIREGVKRAQDYLEANQDNLDDFDWWAARVEKAAERGRAGATAFVHDQQAAYRSAATFAADSVEKTRKIYTHRQAILDLPKNIASGDVKAVQRFVDTALMDIDPQLAAEIKNNPEWPAVIELIQDNEAILTYLAYVDLFVSSVPPNFFAYVVGKGGAYVLAEIVLLIVCSLLSAGAATAGRLTMLAARFASMGARTARAAAKINKAQAAVKAFASTVEDFAAAAQDMQALGQKLKLARPAAKVRGKTGTTIEVKRKQELRNKRCRVCGKADRKTPRHMRGTVEYV